VRLTSQRQRSYAIVRIRPQNRRQTRPRSIAKDCDLTGLSAGCLLSTRQQYGGPSMAIEARIRELGSRHETLERAIQDEISRPAGDDLRIRELKRRKLRLKEEMETLRGRVH
jgi:hypothetical protein